ncbi:MAG: hypothetical protein RL023_722 [Candidatus Parcubacteria bacterium]
MVKVFSNFDTSFPSDIYKKYVDIYGTPNVLFVRRSVIYILYNIILPLLLWLFFISSIIYILVFLLPVATIIIEWIVLILLTTSGFFILRNVGKHIMDFYLDFTIITPRFIMEYDQMGIFSRVARSLDVKKIKAIKVDKKGFLKSVFNYGNIFFYGEGDEAIPDIGLYYIYDPLTLRDRISRLIHI